MSFVDVPIPVTVTIELGAILPLSWESSLYLHGLLLVPFAVSIAAFRIFKAVLPASKRPAMLTLAVTTGQAIWFGINTATIPYGLHLVGTDLAICVAILAWLFLMPGVYAASALILYESIGAAIKILAIAEVPVDSLVFQGLLVHILLRVLIIGCAAHFIYRRRGSADREAISDIFA